MGRRWLIERSPLAVAAALCAVQPAEAQPAEAQLAVSPGPERRDGQSAAYPRTLVIPLTDCGGSYCAVYRVDGAPFRAVVDTGSPFLSVAGSCTKRWGCYQGEGQPAGLEDTWEMYDGREGAVFWRRGDLAFRAKDGDLERISDSIVFGVLSDTLVGRPGGVFLGLVKRESEGIRPTFLSQTPFEAFCFDLRQWEQPKLVLSTAPLVPADAKWLPMVDLRPFGSPVEHYAARVSGLRVNGRELRPKDGKPIYAIFDTGTTGLAISCKLWDCAMDDYLEYGSAPWTSTVDVDMRSRKNGQPVRLSVNRPFPTTPIQQLSWKHFDGHLMVLGLSFLSGRALTVDVDHRKMWLGYGV
jgi:hypothetical protein